MITKFGQYVLMSVHNADGLLVFQTDSLRVDFDIRHIRGWSRAKFDIYNLAPDTIKKLSNGDNYVTIETALHDSEKKVIANKMYISNAMEEIDVPNSITSLFCYSNLRKHYLERQIDISVEVPTLRKIINDAVKASGYKGVVVFKYFPTEVLDFIPPRPKSRQKGSLLDCIELLSKAFKFNMYTEDDTLIFMYKPDFKNLSDTDMYTSEGDVVLDTKNMRSNPKIGVATISVLSNLDPSIKATTILNTTKLITAGIEVDQVQLELNKDYLRDKVAGSSKYQTLSVQHKGSNFTREWSTQAAATTPTKGTTMPTYSWFN